MVLFLTENVACSLQLLYLGVAVQVLSNYHEMYIAQMCVINPRCACTARITVLGLSFCMSVRQSVSYHFFCRYVQQGGQEAMLTGSVPLALFLNAFF